MKTASILLVSVAISITLIGCDRGSNSEPSRIVVVPGQLSQRDLQVLRHEALLGDARAADRLAFYYAIDERSPGEELRWWTVAAENGDRGAMRALGVSMVKKGPDDCLRSIFWLERASTLYPRWHDESAEVQAELSRAKTGLAECVQRLSANGGTVTEK